MYIVCNTNLIVTVFNKSFLDFFHSHSLKQIIFGGVNESFINNVDSDGNYKLWCGRQDFVLSLNVLSTHFVRHMYVLQRYQVIK